MNPIKQALASVCCCTWDNS